MEFQNHKTIIEAYSVFLIKFKILEEPMEIFEVQL